MIGFIIISALLLCGVITLLAILFMRPSEVPISDKSIDLSAVLPIQTITDSVIVNGSGDLLDTDCFFRKYLLFRRKMQNIYMRG